MLLVRWLVFALLVAGLACFAIGIVTGRPRYRALGLRLIQGTVIAGLVFFAVLIAERLASFK